MDNIRKDSPEDDPNNTPPDDSENNSGNNAVNNSSRIEDPLDQINKLKSQIKILISENELLQYEYSQMESDVLNLRKTNNQSKSKITQLYDEKAQLKLEITELQKDIAVMKSRYSELTCTPLMLSEIVEIYPNDGKICLHAHDYPGNFVELEFLPEEISGTRIYAPQDNPRELELRRSLKAKWKDKYGY